KKTMPWWNTPWQVWTTTCSSPSTSSNCPAKTKYRNFWKRRCGRWGDEERRHALRAVSRCRPARSDYQKEHGRFGLWGVSGALARFAMPLAKRDIFVALLVRHYDDQN